MAGDDNGNMSWFALISGLLLLSSVAGAQETGRVRDSLGVRIVEHGELRRLTPFKIAERPLLDLGGLKSVPDEELDWRNPFLAARPLSDGRWVAIDWGMLKVFEDRGRYIRTIGRPGRGPGELGQLRDLCIATGDTIVALGLMDRRIGVFDSSGSPVSTTALPSARIGTEACLGDGTVLVRHETFPDANAALERFAQVDRVRWDGTLAGTFGVMPIESLDGMIGQVANIAGSGDRVYVGNGDTPEYRVHSASGELLQIVRWQARPRRVTKAWREALIKSGSVPGPVERENFPFYGEIRPAPSNTVWIQDYPFLPGRRLIGYSVFDADGGFVGRVEAPPGMARTNLGWIGPERVLLMWRDDEGSHLTLHRIVPR